MHIKLRKPMALPFNRPGFLILSLIAVMLLPACRTTTTKPAADATQPSRFVLGADISALDAPVAADAEPTASIRKMAKPMTK
jgi:hypothetical protein